MATSECEQEYERRTGRKYAAARPWHVAVELLLRRLRVPGCGERVLRRHAEALAAGDVTESDALSVEIARLHGEGTTDELLNEIHAQYPAEADAMDLPSPTKPPETPAATGAAEAVEGDGSPAPAPAAAAELSDAGGVPANSTERPLPHPASIALAVLFEEPDIQVSELAKRAGVSPGTLYSRGKRWKSVRATLMARGKPPADVLGGYKDRDVNVEAWEKRESDCEA